MDVSSCLVGIVDTTDRHRKLSMHKVRAYLYMLLIAGCCYAHSGLAAPAESPRNSGGTLPEPIAWRQLSFSIPFKIATDVSEQPGEVRLYVSKDRGSTWELGQT